jgi:preprotein translocase subunit YajC
MQMAPFAIILVIMYFLILRPQQKRAKAHADMIAAVRRGDTVVTAGGLVARVTKVTDDPEIEVELAPNVRVRVIRSMITDVRTKGEPVKD